MERNLGDGRRCRVTVSLAVVSPSDMEGSDFSQEPLDASIY